MKYFLVFVCFSVLTTPAFSDDISRQAGSKSLNFSFNDFALEDYKYGIGGKYWFSNDTAITASVNLQNNEQETESTSGGTPSQSSQDTTLYGFTLGAEKHFHSSTSLSPYVGGEVFYSDSDADASDNIDTTTRTWGANVLLGAEYAFTDAIALAAEYAFGYRDGEAKSSNTTGSSTSTSKGFSVASSKLILLLYF